MYLSAVTIENFRCFGNEGNILEICFRPGLTVLVGENDVGKTAIIDAIRFVLGTTDQEWNRIDSSDFYQTKDMQSKEIKITCKFQNLNAQEKGAFAEYLTYENDDENIDNEKTRNVDVAFYITWTVKDTGDVFKGRPYRRIEIHSGKNGDGPSLDPKVRELLRATYMRPLRDAEQALSSGRSSRLSQVLSHTPAIRDCGCNFDLAEGCKDPKQLNVLGIGDFANYLFETQEGVKKVREEIDQHIENLSLKGEEFLQSQVKVSGSENSEIARLRSLLEKLDLSLGGFGKPGLGSNNLLFMACELLLLDKENEGSKLLLIEEPEAHLHAQRQLQVMKFLQKQSETKGIQIMATTHSPNLASVIDLKNIVMVHQEKAFSMAEGETNLESSDYRFLQRFLDVTKANLFFARGVMIVEGDAENILLPTLAKILDRDFTEHGISIVNVGGVGLRRYARIFQRKNEEKDGTLPIPVACVTDMDIMPDCAPLIIGKIKDDEPLPALNKRKWRSKQDFSEKDLEEHREKIFKKASGQKVQTFISDEWTLEYDLSLGPKDSDGNFHCGLAEDVFTAAVLAENDDAINEGAKKISEIEEEAITQFEELKKGSTSKPQNGCSSEEVLASNVYAKFARNGVSKTIAAQYLSERLQNKYDKGELPTEELRKYLPKYLVQAIDYVTGHDQVRDNGDSIDE